MINEKSLLKRTLDTAFLVHQADELIESSIENHVGKLDQIIGHDECF